MYVFTEFSYVFAKSSRTYLKGDIHSQLYRAISLCDGVPHVKKLSKLRSFDRQ